VTYSGMMFVPSFDQVGKDIMGDSDMDGHTGRDMYFIFVPVKRMSAKMEHECCGKVINYTASPSI
jgi:hypothetical protein